MQVHHDQGPSSPEQGTSRRNDPSTWSGASDSSKQVHHEEAESIIHDLQKMQCNEDKFNNKTSLPVDLRKIALDKGFTISDNGGSGNCMFFALSEQLRSVKRVHISHEELRKTLVQCLSENANLHDGSPLFNFVSGYPSWPEYLGSMAKDGTWGDHLVLLSAANYFQIPIHIISNLGHDIVINPDRPVATTYPLVLGHVHELHYVSLLPIQDKSGEEKKRFLLQCSTQDFKRAKLTTVEESATEENKEISSLYHTNSPPQLSIKLPKISDLPNTSTPWNDADLPVDVLLLTVEDCEFLSCFFYLDEPFKSYCRDIGYVYFGSMGKGNQKKLKIALVKCSKGSAVPGGSLTAVKNAVRILRPKAVFSVGTCIGLNSEKTKLGDVVVSSKLTTSVYRTPVSRDIGNLIRHVADGWKAPLENPDAREVRVRCDGDVLSHPEAASFGWQNEQIIQKYPKAIAVDTEGEGVFAAAHDDKVEWVLVKGVASCADHSQDSTDEWESFASTIAASVVANILSDPIIFQEWPHCDQVPLYRELEDKVKQLEQEVKSTRMEDFKPEPSAVETFDAKTCRTKLAEHYQRTATVPTSVWAKASGVDIHEIYTRLSWVKQEQTPAGSSQSELTPYSDLFTANKNGVVRRRILVQGQTGIGKSTFVKKLAVDWAELDDEKTGDEQTAALKKFELVVVVNLKEVSKYESLSDVISRSRIFAEEDKSLTEGLLTYITNNQEKVLMVFDGYDEYRSGRNSDIYEIFKGERLGNCCVLITTRNSKADELLEFKDLHAEITGFSLQDVNVFTEKILGSWEQAENLLDHLAEKNLEGLAKVPLLLLYFCTLWKNGQLKSFPKTKTKLYMAIVQYVLDHTQGKHSPRRSGKVHDFKEILVEIGKVALEGLLKNDHVFEYEELSAAIRCQESFIIGLLQVTEYTDSLRPAGMVCFIHKSIQEFVAAWYITHVCIPEGNLGPVEKHARSLEDCQALENVFQFVCGLTDEGAVKVFKHLDSVRISDTSLNLCTVPDVDVPLCDITERHWKFNDFVLDSFQEVQSKAELSKNCFDCVGGIILVRKTLFELHVPFVNDLKSWSIYFLRKEFWGRMSLFLDSHITKPASCNLYKWLVSCNNGSSELHELRSFLERWQSVVCKSCAFDSCICLRNDQMYIYITDLWLSCSAHATLLTEASKSAVPSDSANLCSELFNLKFLGSLACKDSVGESFPKALGTMFRNCKHLRNIRLNTAGNLLCDILKQLPNPDKYSLCIGFPQVMGVRSFFTSFHCNLKSEEAVELAGLLPRFDNIIVLDLNSKDCSAAAMTTLVSSITHKNLQELQLIEIRMTPEVVAALGQSLPKLSSLQKLELTGTKGGINLQAADMETLFGGFNEPSPLMELRLTHFNMRGSRASLAKRLCFFPNLEVLSLNGLNLDGSDLCGLLESFSFIPNLSVLSLGHNPLGHAVTSIVPHLTKLPKGCIVHLVGSGCSEEDRIHVEKAVKQLRHGLHLWV